MTDEAIPADATTDEVAERLKESGIEGDVVTEIKDRLGVATVDDLSLVSEADLVTLGVKPIQARKLIASLVPSSTTSVDGAVAIDTTLPALPTDTSWLESLKAGGVLKVDQSTVIAAVRAALAWKVGLYDIPAKLVKAMEEFADTASEPVNETFYKVRKQLTQRRYADIFEAIEGLDASYVTDTRKKELFKRIEQHLWPAILSFQVQLRQWIDSWTKEAVSPTVLLTALAGGKAGMPPGIIQAPDTGVLFDHVDALNDAANKVFAGTGAQIASALAYEAAQVMQTLDNAALPALVGAPNREQMLRQLGVSVNATYPRLETNLTRFVWSAMQAKSSGADEATEYFVAMHQLGGQITWDQLGLSSGAVSGMAGRVQL